MPPPQTQCCLPAPPAPYIVAADVLTIENSRSGDAMLRALASSRYGRDIGAGVYDVHSPVVPSAEFVKRKIRWEQGSEVRLVDGAQGA